MNENASGFIKLEFADGGLHVDVRLHHIGIEDKMNLLDGFLDGLHLSAQAAILLLKMYSFLQESGGVSKTQIDLGTIKDMTGDSEEGERWGI